MSGLPFREFPGTKRFQILGRLGAGGMGVVYEALDRERNERVALKTLKQWSGDALLRFKNEFRAFQDLSHPNLVKLGELVEHEGFWFFTMELVRGVDFLGYVRPGHVTTDSDTDADTNTASGTSIAGMNGSMGALDEARLRDALAQLVEGLLAIHAAGRVHRDVKPSNIRVTHDGRVVLLDFGLATVSEVHHSTEATVVGTALYMAPEQAAAIPVGPEADLYSVGAILYEALTNSTPFAGPAIRVMVEKQRTEARPASTLAPRVPADLDRLASELLRIDPKSRPSAVDLLRRLKRGEVRAVSVSNVSYALCFVGRKRELSVLEDAFVQLNKRRPTAVYIEGESGIGKSALVRTFEESLVARDPNVIVLTGRCYEREALPYKGIDGVVDALARKMNRLPHAEALIPRMAASLRQVFPVLTRVEAIAQAPELDQDILEPQELRRRVFGALRELLTRLGDRFTVVMVVEDLQWADADSLALLKEILREPDGPRLLTIATIRSTGEGWIRPDLPNAREIRLGPLLPPDAVELARRLSEQAGLPGSISPDALAEEAAGRPLFIHELTRYHSEVGPLPTGPLKLEEALLARISRLQDEARRILDVLAISGAPLTHATASSASRLRVADFTRHVMELRTANLVRTTGTRLSDLIECYHDRVRAALLSRLNAPERRQHHEHLALAIETSERPDLEAMALHWRAAGNPLKAAQFAAKAADHSAEALAFDRAARLYALALELGQYEGNVQRMLRTKLGHTLAHGGRGKDAAEAYLAAAQGANEAEALDLRRLAAQQLLLTGHIDEGVDAIRSVLTASGLRYPKTPRRALSSVVFGRAKIRLRGMRFRLRDESTVPSRELALIDASYHAGVGLATVDPIMGSAFQIGALIRALQAGEPFRLARSIGIEIGYLATGGGKSRKRVERLLGIMRRLAEQLNHPNISAYLLGVTGQVNFLSGFWRKGLELCAESEQIFRERCVGVKWEINTMRVWQARSLLNLGRFDELARRVPAALDEYRERGDLYGDATLRCSVYPFVWLAQDDHERAEQEITRALQQWSTKGFHIQHYYALVATVALRLYAGEPQRAQSELDDKWRALSRSMLMRVQMIRIVIWDLRARIALARAASETANRKRLHRRARADARRIAREGMAWSQPLADVIHGGAAAIEGQHENAVRHLRAAAEGFDRAEMALHAATARRRLGQLLDGAEARALIEDAERWMSTQRIVDPERWTNLYVPFGR